MCVGVEGCDPHHHSEIPAGRALPHIPWSTTLWSVFLKMFYVPLGAWDQPRSAIPFRRDTEILDRVWAFSRPHFSPSGHIFKLYLQPFLTRIPQDRSGLWNSHLSVCPGAVSTCSSSRSVAWQMDCFCWPMQDFFNKNAWDWATKMVLILGDSNVYI